MKLTLLPPSLTRHRAPSNGRVMGGVNHYHSNRDLPLTSSVDCV